MSDYLPLRCAMCDGWHSWWLDAAAAANVRPLGRGEQRWCWRIHICIMQQLPIFSRISAYVCMYVSKFVYVYMCNVFVWTMRYLVACNAKTIATMCELRENTKVNVNLWALPKTSSHLSDPNAIIILRHRLWRQWWLWWLWRKQKKKKYFLLNFFFVF